MYTLINISPSLWSVSLMLSAWKWCKLLPLNSPLSFSNFLFLFSTPELMPLVLMDHFLCIPWFFLLQILNVIIEMSVSRTSSDLIFGFLFSVCVVDFHQMLYNFWMFVLCCSLFYTLLLFLCTIWKFGTLFCDRFEWSLFFESGVIFIRIQFFGLISETYKDATFFQGETKQAQRKEKETDRKWEREKSFFVIISATPNSNVSWTSYGSTVFLSFVLQQTTIEYLIWWLYTHREYDERKHVIQVLFVTPLAEEKTKRRTA